MFKIRESDDQMLPAVFSILAGGYRAPTHRYDDTFLVVAGLSNFHTMNSLAW
jgi:hypothetical protein